MYTTTEKSFFLLFLTVFVSQCTLSYSAKILAVFPFPGPSQFICVKSYLQTLAARGHEVTVISAFPQQDPLPNYRDIIVENIIPDYDELISDVAMIKFSKWELMSLSDEFVASTTENLFRNEQIQKLIHSGAQFDLVIIEVFQMEALYSLAHHFKAHLIGLSTFGTDPKIDELVGNVSPVSFTPLVSSSLMDRMNFWQRFENLWLHTLEFIHFHYYSMPQQIALYHRYMPNATLDLRDYRKRFALVLLNQHFSLNFPRPYVPNAVEVAGMHIQHIPKKLPADMEAFINASAQGAIYFSLGSNIKSKSLPPEKRDVLLQTFASLPVNVLWKFEDTELPGKPANVYINKWFPQPDILANPKVRLFITHGGMLSTIEAIHHAKPIVGMPFFYDQHVNVARAQQSGYGLGVTFGNLTVAELRGAIMKVLQDYSFTERAKTISRRYHDQPMKPLERAIFWTEYILRHDGASHMRVAAQELNFVQVNSLDTIALLFGGATLLLLLVFWVVVRAAIAIIVCWKGSKKTRSTKQKRH